MSQPYVGEIRLVGFNFEVNGWAFCNGQLLSIAENEVLFELIGTTYGGDGQQTFGLPDLRGRAIVHQGPGFVIGQRAGVESVTLNNNQIPVHNHALQVSSAVGTTNNPAGKHLAASPLALGNVYGTPADTISPEATVGLNGGSQPHENMQPFLCMNYIISLFGVFPTQN